MKPLISSPTWHCPAVAPDPMAARFDRVGTPLPMVEHCTSEAAAFPAREKAKAIAANMVRVQVLGRIKIPPRLKSLNRQNLGL
jgi:hypothetical protein